MSVLQSKNFVIIGAAGYVAPRHIKAIKDTGNKLLAVYDPYDGIGILDSYFPEADYFREFERFDRHLDLLNRKGIPIDYVSICSPNYLHDAHIRFGLRIGADIICEKPLVLNPWNIDALKNTEAESGRKVNTILQLRLHPAIQKLKEDVQRNPEKSYKIDLRYITSRGRWYQYSWKGDVEKSGGIATNIGIHFFDMLTWIFGKMTGSEVFAQNERTASGFLKLERAEINWILSIDENELPESVKNSGQRTFRSMTMDGNEISFSDGFADLHTESYREILAGRGFGLEDARESVAVAHAIRALVAQC